jgi:hypothetical protein
MNSPSQTWDPSQTLALVFSSRPGILASVAVSSVFCLTCGFRDMTGPLEEGQEGSSGSSEPRTHSPSDLGKKLLLSQQSQAVPGHL